jgi:hypothetical protein
MSYETILYDVSGPVATITLNRPDAINAISPQVTTELHHALDAADADPAVRAIILTGAGRGFTLVDQATAMHARAEKTKRINSREELYRAAERLFERAQELLGEAIDNAPPRILAEIEHALDRPISRNPHTKLVDFGLDPQSVPRKRGSRSRYAKQAVVLQQSTMDRLRGVKEAYLQAQLDELLGSHAQTDVDKRMKDLRALIRLARPR